ncbi:MAG: sorbosone dehydrogenase family protein [Bdellovibrionaceae bacterium]|nr:sorbosone dehydrogenase family protein [Pseudobdellovibrionaceae bacterium]
MKKHKIAVTAAVTSFILGLGWVSWAEKNPVLPPPNSTASVTKQSTVIPWPADTRPTAPAGFEVSVFAELDAPRNILVLPSGEILVSQAAKKPSDSGENSPNQITKYTLDAEGAIAKAEVFLDGIELPFGMAVWEDQFFVATPTEILRYPFVNGVITGPGTVIAQLPFPQPQRHWTRDLKIAPDGSKMFISVGSVSNHGEDGDPLDPMTAAILVMNLDGSDLKVYASGVRNAVTMAFEPTTGALWATVNERDELGDGLVPDFLIAVKEGGFYGWPYAYYGANADPRLQGQRPDLVAATIVPNFSVGAHTASTGITFTTGTKFPAPYNEGALISQHGSWNSSALVGYKLIYVPFVDGDAVDPEQDFLTGFVADAKAGTVYGRPVMAAVLPNGTVLVTDDGGHKIWQVKPVTASPHPQPE